MQTYKKNIIFTILGVSFIALLLFLSTTFHRHYAQTVKIPGGELTEGVIGVPRFINPVLARFENAAEQDLTELVFSKLLTHAKNGKIQYRLAEDLTQSEDGKTYTLFLKKDIFFQDGAPITADDVIFTIEKIKDPMLKSPLQNKWDGVETKKIDEHTVQFHLVQKYSDFPYNLEIGVLPQHLWEHLSGDEFIFSKLNTQPIGSGYYQVENISYDEDKIPTLYSLRPSPFAKSYLQKVKIYLFGNNEDLLRAFKHGEINGLYGINRNEIITKKGVREYTGKLPRVFGLFYHKQKDTLLAQKEIRQYINASIDRKSLTKNIFGKYAYPINTATGIFKEEYISSLQPSYLEQHGWKKNHEGIYFKGEKKLAFEISTLNIPDLIAVAEDIKQQGKKKGIQFTIKAYDTNDFRQQVIRQRNYEILLYGYIIEKPTDLYAFWHSSQAIDPGLNVSGYKNAKIDTLLEKLRKEGEKDIEEEIIEILHRDVPASFLYSPAYIYLLPSSLRGVTLHIKKRSDRFDTIQDWYMTTRKVWGYFIR